MSRASLWNLRLASHFLDSFYTNLEAQKGTALTTHFGEGLLSNQNVWNWTRAEQAAAPIFAEPRFLGELEFSQGLRDMSCTLRARNQNS